MRESKVLPEYASTLLPQVIERASNLQNEKTVDLIFITDLHHQVGGNMLQAAAVVRKLTESVSLDCIVSGGDMSMNGVKSDVLQSQREIMSELAVAKCPILPVIGNHDDNTIHDFHNHPNSVDNVIFPGEAYEEFFCGLNETVSFDKGNVHGLYYYYEIPAKKTRVIILNCIDIPYQQTENGNLKYNGQWQYAFSDKQLNWVAHTALDFSSKPDKEKWSVIFFSHIAILQEGVYGADNDIANGEVMWEIIKGYKNGTSYSSAPTSGDFASSVNVDYSGQGQGSVVACFFGHVHFDQVVRRDGINLISTLNAYTNQDFEDAPERIKGTESDTAFDILTIDYSKGKLFMTRFGAGQDRVVEL